MNITVKDVPPDLHERHDGIGSEQAVELLEDALALMKGSAYEVPPERVLAVARRTGCSGYDSQYVALAEDLGLRFYTCDQRLLQSCPHVAIEPA